MSSDIKIPEISQKHLLGIKYLTVEDINKILELGIFFKLKNKPSIINSYIKFFRQRNHKKS